VGRTWFVLASLGRGNHLSGNFQRAMVWWSATGVLWLAGGLETGDLRTALWMAAVLAQYVGVWIGFPVPGLGRSRTTDYTIVGGHLAERCQLFVLLALGESILVIGADFGEIALSGPTALAFAVAFAGSVALWWIYFDRGAEAGRRAMSAASDPGRLGISAYNYCHVPMVAGIIVAAAADGLTMAPDRKGNGWDDGPDPGRFRTLPARQRAVRVGARWPPAALEADRRRRARRAPASVPGHFGAGAPLCRDPGYDLRGDLG
jgi:low temperature requirement protein LtrA